MRPSSALPHDVLHTPGTRNRTWAYSRNGGSLALLVAAHHLLHGVRCDAAQHGLAQRAPQDITDAAAIRLLLLLLRLWLRGLALRSRLLRAAQETTQDVTKGIVRLRLRLRR